MFPSINPKDLQKMMDRMGIKSEEIKAKKVVIEKEDGQIIIIDPQVTMIDMKGQKSFQIVGKIDERAKIDEEDVKLVMQKTNASKEDVEKALQESNGNIADAIMKLQR